MPPDSPLPIEPRRVSRTTPLAGPGPLAIAAPVESEGLRAAERLAGALGRLGVEAEALADPPPSLLHEADRPVFLLGNLADSRCARDLYHRLLCVTDRCYPGPGGYELRTLLDPLGTGHNIIHLGYSDDDGLAAGLEALLERLTDPLPFLSEVRPSRLPLCAEDVEGIHRTPLPRLPWQIANFCHGDHKGYLAYLTGDATLLEEYHTAWRAVLACGYERNEKIVQPHLFMLSHVGTWRLLEAVGLIPDGLQRGILGYIRGWAQSPDGVEHLRHTIYQSPHYPRQNHGLVPALALMYAADYFQRHHPDLPEPAEWLRVARQVFAPYQSSWKPICDGLCHAWYVSQPLIQEYALLDPEHRHFAAGGARLAADCAVAVVNNQGWMPSAGDSDLPWALPGPSLRIAAEWYRDGAYAFVHNRAPEFLRLRAGEVASPTRAFDVGLAETAPPTPLITVVPMDPLVYDVWSHHPELASGVTDTPPAVPIGSCFDKLAVRTGWGVDDDYLLIDGLGGGSHSYADAASILDYARFGLSCIVCEDNLVWSAPEHHSMVTVTRDGQMGPVPSFPALEASEADADGNAYLRIVLPGFAGADWVREICLRRGRCLVVHDTVIAREVGEFAVEAHFRTPARAELSGRQMRNRRHSATAGPVEFLLTCVTDGAALSLDEIPIGLVYRQKIDDAPVSVLDDPEAMWRLRYQADDIALSAFTSRLAARMAPGQSVSLTHLAQIRGQGEPELTLGCEAGGLLLSDGTDRWHLPVCHGPAEPIERRRVPAARAVLPVAEIATLPAPVTCLTERPDGGALCGTEDGTVAALGPDGNSLWRYRVEGPVHDMAAPVAESPVVLIGHGAAGLTALDDAGGVLWQRTIVREPCPWPWWELLTPAPVQVAGGVFAGETLFAIGCGDIQVRLLDSEGNQRWMWRYNEGVPGRIRVADVDGDGVPEILVGGDILSDQSTCRILTHEGRVKADLAVEGWTSSMTALDWATVGGRPLLACGATRGRNLHLYDLSGIGPGRPEHLFEKRLGGTVTALVIDARRGLLVVGTSQGFVLGYELDGALRWSRLLAEGIVHLLPWDERFIAQQRSGQCCFVSADGEVAPAEADGPAWRCVCPAAGGYWVASDCELRRLAVIPGQA